MNATATFFRRGGRLRVRITCPLLTRGEKEWWVERAGTDHRYKFAKVTGIYTPHYRSHLFVSESDYMRLQTAQEGDVIEFEMNPKEGT